MSDLELADAFDISRLAVVVQILANEPRIVEDSNFTLSIRIGIQHGTLAEDRLIRCKSRIVADGHAKDFVLIKSCLTKLTHLVVVKLAKIVCHSQAS